MWSSRAERAEATWGDGDGDGDRGWTRSWGDKPQRMWLRSPSRALSRPPKARQGGIRSPGGAPPGKAATGLLALAGRSTRRTRGESGGTGRWANKPALLRPHSPRDIPGGASPPTYLAIYPSLLFPLSRSLARRSLALPWCGCGGGARDLGLGPGETPYTTSTPPPLLSLPFCRSKQRTRALTWINLAVGLIQTSLPSSKE
jgi:hypothetical protein